MLHPDMPPAAMLIAKETMLRRMNQGPRRDLLAGAPSRRISMRTWMWLLSILLLPPLCVWFFGLDSLLTTILSMAAMFAVPAAIFMFLSGLLRDFSIPSLRARTTPVRGLKTLVRSALANRLDSAWFCLVPGERERLSPQDLGHRWLAISDKADATVETSHFRVLEQEGTLARAFCRVRWSREKHRGLGAASALLGFGAAIASELTKERGELDVTKIMRLIDGQWYALSGEPESPEDRLWEDALDLAALGNSELEARVREAGIVMGQTDHA